MRNLVLRDLVYYCWTDQMISKFAKNLQRLQRPRLGGSLVTRATPESSCRRPFYFFPTRPSFAFPPRPLVAPFSSWRVYLFRTLALRALCPPRSLLYHSLSHLISLLWRFSPSLLQAKEILMQHRPMSKERAETPKNKLNNINNNSSEGIFEATLHGPLFANKTCHCLNLNRGD